MLYDSNTGFDLTPVESHYLLCVVGTLALTMATKQALIRELIENEQKKNLKLLQNSPLTPVMNAVLLYYVS